MKRGIVTATIWGAVEDSVLDAVELLWSAWHLGIRQGELMEETGYGRAAVRVALRRLEVKGLVMRTFGGWRPTTTTPTSTFISEGDTRK